MGRIRTAKRYTAFLRGWCQAFGEHHDNFDEAAEVNWLFADDQMGLILAAETRRAVFHAILGHHREPPRIHLRRDGVTIGELDRPMTSYDEERGLKALRALADGDQPLHLYLTYHFAYPTGTRIVTFSRRSPLPLMYKLVDEIPIEID